MKRTMLLALNAIAVVLSAQVMAAPLLAVGGEDDLILERQNTLSNMEFKRDQLNLQAEMATYYKQMTDAGLLVDAEGNPLGVKSIGDLANDVRKRADSSNPFALNGQMPGIGNQFGQPNESPSTQHRAGQNKQSDADDIPRKVRLVQVSSDSIIVRTADGDRVLRIGDKVDDLVLTKFDSSRAYLKGPSGTEVISIDWSKR